MENIERMIGELKIRQDQIARDSHEMHVQILDRLNESRKAEDRIESRAITRPQLFGLGVPIIVAVAAGLLWIGASLGTGRVDHILGLPDMGAPHGAP